MTNSLHDRLMALYLKEYPYVVASNQNIVASLWCYAHVAQGNYAYWKLGNQSSYYFFKESKVATEFALIYSHQ